MSKVIACIDGSAYTASVCEHAQWAAARLDASLEYLHVLERHPEAATHRDLSGNMGFGESEALLQDLAEIDQSRGKLAQQRARVLSRMVEQHSASAQVASTTRLRHGDLVETLLELEQDTRLIILGKHGDSAVNASPHLGANVERVLRAVHRPVLVVTQSFAPVQRVVIAFDGSATIHNAIQTIASSPLRGLPCHVVMAGSDTPANTTAVQGVVQELAAAGFQVNGAVHSGHPETVIPAQVQALGAGLLVMGAYGHSRIRQLIVGSMTTTMLRNCAVPVLILR
jgi:nucleotide-binding universal stress UspA family protein